MMKRCRNCGEQYDQPVTVCEICTWHVFEEMPEGATAPSEPILVEKSAICWNCGEFPGIQPTYCQVCSAPQRKANKMVVLDRSDSNKKPFKPANKINLL